MPNLIVIIKCQMVTSSRPNDAYMHQLTRPSLIQIMACRLIGAQPISEKNAGILFIGHLEKNYSEILIEIEIFSTLTAQAPSYLGLTRSISWLLMPRLLTSPGHQQPWYWLYRICSRSFSYWRKCFKYLCQINVEEWHKMQIYVYVS